MRAIFAIIITTCSACSLVLSSRPKLAPQAPPSTLRGYVQNDSGWHLKGLSILAISEGKRGSRVGLSDERGNFVIDDLSPGPYRLLILRGASLISEQRLLVPAVAVRDVHLIVPSRFGDRPGEGDGPIVDRALVQSSAR